MSSLSTFLWVISVFIHVIPVVLTKKIHFHPSSEFVSNCKHGDFVILKYDRYIGRSLREYGEWSDGELSEIYSHYVKQRSVVLDVGANIGAFTVPLGKLAGPYGVVHAFEPLRTVHNLMVTNTVLNGLINVVPHLAFVGEQKSKAPVISRPTQEELMKKAPHIQYTIPNNYGSLQWTEESLEEREGTHEVDLVPQVAIDDLGLWDCTLIKIDVEGHEMAVLKGAKETITRYQPAIYLEIDRAELTNTLLRYLLFVHQYHCYEHSVPLYNADNHKGGEAWSPHSNYGEDILFIFSRNALCVSKKSGVKALPKALRGVDPLIVE